ncbi:hypothetical protein M9Y10_018229 [Tritrichomonas musculus]|uniref:ADF-H domain-containing protein n=1 Tax=Tritrichomonas musculus TaxID=1915356 RepID=A0ABR2HPP5_9EUKA
MHAEEYAKIHDDCINKWKEMKNDHKYRYLILNFTENFEYIIVEKAASIDKTFDDLINDLPLKDVRYALFDNEYVNDDKLKQHQLILVVWGPDEASVRKKCSLHKHYLKLGEALLVLKWKFNQHKFQIFAQKTYIIELFIDFNKWIRFVSFGSIIL